MQTKESQSDGKCIITEPVFSGFTAWAFGWFAGLERDNTRDYFTATRDRYEIEVRGAMMSMLRELRAASGGTMRVFRQQNDMRFSPAVPYKTRTYGALDFDTPISARLYADISARGLYAGTGYHRLASDQLTRFREGVVDAECGTRLVETLATARDAGLELIFDSLVSVPRGYPRDHPRADLLKSRSLLAGRLLAGESGIDRDAALEHVAGTWRAAAGLTDWLDNHVGPSTQPVRQRWSR